MNLPRISLLAFPLFVLAAALLASCQKSPSGTDCCRDWDHHLDPYPAPTSPANVAETLRKSYELRDIDEYRKVFASDFVFVFDPEDLGAPGFPTPPSWGIAEEMEWTAHLFQSEAVDRIALSFVISEPVPQPDGLARVEVTEVRLSIDARDSEGRPVRRGFSEGTETFFFRSYPEEPMDGKPIWRIVRWEDKGAAQWGQIKARYR